MIRVRLWAPESDYDQDAVVTIAKGIKQLYSLDIEICGSSKSAFHDAIHKDSKDGLRKATENYLKMDQFVLFLLDLDGAQSIAQRRCESNSLVSQIERVSSVNSRVKLIFMDKELEAWFLVDVLGVCCFYNRKNGKPTRTDKRWVTFAKRNQSGKTENIFEPVLGGKGVKEHLVRLSREMYPSARVVPIEPLADFLGCASAAL
jgi:hypothetical protein